MIDLVYYLPVSPYDNQNRLAGSSRKMLGAQSMETMSRPKVNIGIIGIGYWGRKIVEEYSRIEG